MTNCFLIDVEIPDHFDSDDSSGQPNVTTRLYHRSVCFELSSPKKGNLWFCVGTLGGTLALLSLFDCVICYVFVSFMK